MHGWDVAYYRLPGLSTMAEIVDKLWKNMHNSRPYILKGRNCARARPKVSSRGSTGSATVCGAV